MTLKEHITTFLGAWKAALTQGSYSQAAKQRFATRTLPLFGGMLAATGMTAAGLITTGMWDAVFVSGWGNIALLLIAHIGFFLLSMRYMLAFPANLVYLVGFAVTEGVLLAPTLATAVTTGQMDAILLALGVTAATFGILAVTVWLTEWDFDLLHLPLTVVTVGLVLVLLAQPTGVIEGWQQSKISAFIVVLFAFHILSDTSRILKRNLAPAYGAVLLYVDVILIFIHLLELLTNRDGR